MLVSGHVTKLSLGFRACVVGRTILAAAAWQECAVVRPTSSMRMLFPLLTWSCGGMIEWHAAGGKWDGNFMRPHPHYSSAANAGSCPAAGWAVSQHATWLPPALPLFFPCIDRSPATPQHTACKPSDMNAGTVSRALVRPAGAAWRTYIKHLERSPRVTKSCTSVIAALAGDALAQYISSSDKERWE